MACKFTMRVPFVLACVTATLCGAGHAASLAAPAGGLPGMVGASLPPVLAAGSPNQPYRPPAPPPRSITPTFNSAARTQPPATSAAKPLPPPSNKGPIKPTFNAAARPQIPGGGAGNPAQGKPAILSEATRQHVESRATLGSGPKITGPDGKAVRVRTQSDRLARYREQLGATPGAPAADGGRGAAAPKPPPLKVRQDDLLKELRQPDSRLSPHFNGVAEE